MRPPDLSPIWQSEVHTPEHDALGFMTLGGNLNSGTSQWIREKVMPRTRPGWGENQERASVHFYPILQKLPEDPKFYLLR